MPLDLVSLPLASACWTIAIIAAAAGLIAWVASTISHDYSWIDRWWSIGPVVYSWVLLGFFPNNHQLLLAALLVTIWGARLTINFARKGGYRPGHQDYRWVVLRSQMGAAAWQGFNIGFIVIFQSLLLVALVAPLAALAGNQPSTAQPTPVSWGDWLIAAVFLAVLAMETIADQQMWRFQQGKQAMRAAGQTPSVNFIQTGLFSHSRHPNYCAELALWWLIFIFGVSSIGAAALWAIIGAILLTAVFTGSTIMTERISRQRYPEYALYQASVWPIIPWPRKRTALPLPIKAATTIGDLSD
ncbi:MAG: DUF1295 domain-containing protein [Propionibacteriaceae bacterium]|jgi:steroid 5-alpha reductase family enzyme|nr:DUF1295 domain-containing protein [Propionibacteriaceae bacterium]